MSHKSISKKYLEVATNDAEVTHIKIEVYYSKGGMNYFTGTNEARGIYLSVTPVGRTLHEGKYWSESYKGFSGIKKHLVDMARYSEKKCDSFVIDTEIKEHLIKYVLGKNKLELNLVIQE